MDDRNARVSVCDSTERQITEIVDGQVDRWTDLCLQLLVFREHVSNQCVQPSAARVLRHSVSDTT
jgi:hypothetical protein